VAGSSEKPETTQKRACREVGAGLAGPSRFTLALMVGPSPRLAASGGSSSWGGASSHGRQAGTDDTLRTGNSRGRRGHWAGMGLSGAARMSTAAEKKGASNGVPRIVASARLSHFEKMLILREGDPKSVTSAHPSVRPEPGLSGPPAIGRILLSVGRFIHADRACAI
jgi:hypothetical protein